MINQEIENTKIDIEKSDSLVVLFKPTHDCKMGCEYCFDRKLRRKDRETKMTLDTFNRTMQIIMNSNLREVELTMHGGECTLMGYQWFKDVFEVLNVYRNFIDIETNLQTGGLHLNKKWFELFKSYGFDAGLSYDGLFQDHRRKGTKEFLKDKIHEHKEIVGRPLGFINVINEHSYKHIIDNYEFYKENDLLHFSFNYVTNPNPGDEYEAVPFEDFVEGKMKYFEYWINDKTAVNERGAIGLLELVMGGLQTICNTNDCRGRWISIHPNGDVYNCSHFYPKEYSFGNVWEVDSVDDLFNSTGCKKLFREVQYRRNTVCGKCDYFNYCYGNCLSDHYSGSADYSKVDPYLCKCFKREILEGYKILKEVDIYNSRDFAPYLMELINQGRFLFKEIKYFLRLNGLDIERIEVTNLNENNLLKSREFKIFRIFNDKINASDRLKGKLMKDRKEISLHSEEELNNLEHNNKFVQTRLKLMGEIYEENKDKINKIFEEGEKCE